METVASGPAFTTGAWFTPATVTCMSALPVSSESDVVSVSVYVPGCEKVAVVLARFAFASEIPGAVLH